MSDRMQTSSSVSGTLGAIRPTAGMSAPHRQHEIVVLARYRGGFICVFRSSIFFSLTENDKHNPHGTEAYTEENKRLSRIGLMALFCEDFMSYGKKLNLSLTHEAKKNLKKIAPFKASDLIELINWEAVDIQLNTFLSKQVRIVKRKIRKKS